MTIAQQSSCDESLDAVVVRARTDRVALGLLYDRHYDTVFRYCLRRLFLRNLAEDVTSDVFLQVARKIARFPGTTQDDFRRWLYRIATNAVNAHIRRSRRRRELLSAAVEAGAVPRGPRTEDTVIEILDWPTVYSAILDLKEREQSVIALRFFEQLSHGEIAKSLRLRPGTVRVVLSRALAKLRQRLGGPLNSSAEDRPAKAPAFRGKS